MGRENVKWEGEWRHIQIQLHWDRQTDLLTDTRIKEQCTNCDQNADLVYPKDPILDIECYFFM